MVTKQCIKASAAARKGNKRIQDYYWVGDEAATTGKPRVAPSGLSVEQQKEWLDGYDEARQ